jgi:hypothetical protein
VAEACRSLWVQLTLLTFQIIFDFIHNNNNLFLFLLYFYQFEPINISFILSLLIFDTAHILNQ